MQDASTLFEAAIAWLRDNYGNYRFYVERDVVWTLQTRLVSLIQHQSLALRIFHHFPMGDRRGINCDLALVNPDDSVALAAEFKYEPSHRRSDIWHTKFPVVFWNEGVGHDIERVHSFVAMGAAAYAVFIDEGGYFRHRPPHPGSTWVDWSASKPGAFSPAVLWAGAKAVIP